MNREELKKMGLSDEQIESVMKAHGKATNDLKKKADRVDGLESQIEDLNGQITERDTQLAELKKVDPEALQAEIERLENENETSANEYQEQLAKQQKDFAIESALRDAKALNTKAVKALLDSESIKLDGETLLGLDDQLKTLQESDPYLFRQEQKTNSPQIFAGGNPNGGATGSITKEQIMKESDTKKRQRLIRENSHLFQ